MYLASYNLQHKTVETDSLSTHVQSRTVFSMVASLLAKTMFLVGKVYLLLINASYFH